MEQGKMIDSLSDRKSNVMSVRIIEGNGIANLECGFIHKQIQHLYAQNVVVSKRKMLS